ncbi:MAG: 2Fe-2S iron-sulfur cluster binding domain-containing protein [Cyanobacteria bacterium SBLK]|nr:2Fe-2S iron-sulfur cluster binding domain-containing protein [Cyanobacteria bacterium SBLK]
MSAIKLFLTYRGDLGQELELDPIQHWNDECFVGSDPRCCLPINATGISPQQGKICLQDGNYYYSDLESGNISYLNKKALEPHQMYRLKTGDLIEFGSVFILIISLGDNPNSDRAPSNQECMPLATVDPSSLTYWQGKELTVSCVGIVEETIDTKTFRFVSPSPLLFKYQPGQFVTLSLPIEGKQVLRSYTLSSSPSRPHTLEITVKRVQGGLVSNWLHDRLKIGDEVKFKGVFGKFTCCDRPAQKLLFISAGSGITPMMSMSRWLLDTAANTDIIFLHSAKTPEDIIFCRELEAIAANSPNFKLGFTVTRLQPGRVWWGYTGRLNETLLKAIAPDFREREVFVCGADGFMQGVKTLLEKENFPMQQYRAESFGGSLPQKSVRETPRAIAPHRPEKLDLVSLLAEAETLSPRGEVELPTNGKAVATAIAPLATVVLAERGKEIECNGEETILEVAAAAGVDLPAGCRMGACGVCKQKLVSGKVTYEGDMTCEEGFVLTCAAKPVGRVAIADIES